MSRCKAFDCDQALDSAMRQFWAKGYEATSIQDLVKATGVNRASLYDTFGGKRELFQKAIERFQGFGERQLQGVVDEASPGLGKVRAILEFVGKSALEDSRGCLLLNASAELACHDASIAAVAKQSRLQIEDLFAACLAQAQELGELTSGRDLRATARFLTASVFGLRMLSKMQPELELVADVVASAMRAVAKVPA